MRSWNYAIRICSMPRWSTRAFELSAVDPVTVTDQTHDMSVAAQGLDDLLCCAKYGYSAGGDDLPVPIESARPAPRVRSALTSASQQIVYASDAQRFRPAGECREEGSS